MTRAQGIRQRWHEEKALDNEDSRVVHLTTLLHSQYKKYLSLCYWCSETPIPIEKWLTQQID